MELRLRKIQLHERKNVELRLEGMRHVRDNYGTTKEQEVFLMQKLYAQVRLCWKVRYLPAQSRNQLCYRK